jgi:transposase
MKKNNTCQQNPRQRTRVRPGSLTIGMDLGDKTSRYCVLDEQGEIVQEGSVGTTKKALARSLARSVAAGWRWKWGRTRRG